MSMLIVDLPGAGEPLRLRGMPVRFDTEVPIAACVDHLESREDVAERTAAAAVNSPRVDLVRGTAALGGAGHVSADSFESGSDLVFDWVAEALHPGAVATGASLGR